MVTAAGRVATARPVPPRAPARIEAPVVLGLIGLGAAAVIALWWKDTPYVSGFADWLTNAGRITGLLAGYAIVVLLALMARVPAMERGIGTDRLARWHAIGGRYTICLSVAHTLLVIWGYAVGAHTNVFHQTGSFISSYPDVLMATVGLGLLVAVGVTSARLARAKLRYETWHFIHLYTYLAIALMFAHQFSTGNDFVHNQQARWLWSAMYLFVAGLLIWYRLLSPVVGYFDNRLQVAEVRPEGPDAVSVYLVGRDLDLLRAEPGQFFRWRFLAPGLWWAANPYSLSAPPRPDWLRITVKVSGDHSASLRNIKPGTKVLAEGPYGSFTAARRKQRQVLLIAGGVGITPLRTLFETLPGSPGDVTLLFRATSPDDLLLRGELDQIASRRGAHVRYLVGPRRKGASDPLSASNLQRLIPGIRGYDVYLCGPLGMTEAARSALIQAGVPRRNIHEESFSF